MALKLSVIVRNAMLDAIETAIGSGPVLKIWSGTPPASITTTDESGNTALAVFDLPADWMAAASGGSKALSGTWQETSANGAGTAAYFRIYTTDETPHIQGTAGATTDNDLVLDNAVIAVGQVVTINTFTLTAGDA